MSALSATAQETRSIICAQTAAMTDRNHRSGQRRDFTRTSTSNRWYSKEYSPEWDKRDASAAEFNGNILKMDGCRFCAGQTREFRDRISERRDGSTKSTAGKNPKLVWFAQMPIRNAATTREVELKNLVDDNPREVRRMVVRIQDFIREDDYD